MALTNAFSASGIKYGDAESTSLCDDLLKKLDKAVEGFSQDITAMTYGKRIRRIVCHCFNGSSTLLIDIADTRKVGCIN